MIAGDARKPVKSEIIFLYRLIAIPGLQQADDVLLKVAPPSCVAAVALDVLLQSVCIVFPKWHRQITGKDVVKCGNIRRALDACMSTKSQDAAARPSNVAEQQLENRCGTNDLYSVRMLSPADCVADRASFFRTRSIREYFRDPQELLFGNSADTLNEFWCVACEMTL